MSYILDINYARTAGSAARATSASYATTANSASYAATATTATNTIVPITNLTASGDSFSTTTSILNYGFNVITAASTGSYVAKLPTPIQGGTVKVLNTSNYPVIIYPSVATGSINGSFLPFTIPADNKAYEFICYENPAPGAWSVAFVAPGTYNTGIMSGILSGSGFVKLMGYGNLSGQYAIDPNPIASTAWGDNPLNQGHYFSGAGNYAFRPAGQAWILTQLRVYTNVYATASDGVTSQDCGLRILTGDFQTQYTQGTNNYVTTGYGLAANPLDTTFVINDFLPNSPSSGSSNVAPNVGDPGTLYKVIDLTTNPIFNNSNININEPSTYKGVMGELYLGVSASLDIYFARGFSFVNFFPFNIAASTSMTGSIQIIADYYTI